MSTRESGWVIEHPRDDFSARYVSLINGELRWTGNHRHAFRMARKEDAENFRETFLLGQGKVVEHGWS